MFLPRARTESRSSASAPPVRGWARCRRGGKRRTRPLRAARCGLCAARARSRCLFLQSNIPAGRASAPSSPPGGAHGCSPAQKRGRRPAPAVPAPVRRHRYTHTRSGEAAHSLARSRAANTVHSSRGCAPPACPAPARNIPLPCRKGTACGIPAACRCRIAPSPPRTGGRRRCLHFRRRRTARWSRSAAPRWAGSRRRRTTWGARAGRADGCMPRPKCRGPSPAG